MAFIDTNVLLYSLSPRPAEERKRRRSLELLDRDDLVLSAQVLQEFYVQATRPTAAHAISRELARTMVVALRRYPVAAVTDELVLAAVATSERFQISYWDAAIIEAARSAGCGVVLSEDLGDGQDYGGVTVRNPFADL